MSCQQLSRMAGSRETARLCCHCRRECGGRNAAAMAAATAAAQAAAIGAAGGRAQFVQALQTHLASIAPAVAANPDASAHLAAAQNIATQLA